MMITRRVFDQFFYFRMALLLAAIVIYGFSHTVDGSLIHPINPPPAIFYVHASVFASWVVLLIVQTGLARSNNVALHRRLGWFGIFLGGVIPVLGVSTAITSQQEATSHLFFAISLNDMILFTIAFWLAIYWRKKPEYHKRLMLIATCCLMGAAIARFPEVPGIPWAYGGVDLLILLGALRDVVVSRKVHVVFRYALPCVIAGQVFALYLATDPSPVWAALLQIVFK
ncbi:hypothetical protein S2091_0041 [Solimicrobium silvestre]|uniref:Membrane protein (DUF2306) n=2 Tax=Solimicrobium silvestre TaxID=2099400 RepID=A0A2S9H4P7_9BURK|nr:hypothetical protein S2091_0041 [Solimicrobium silvestre]